MRTRPLLTLLPMALPALTHASPQPALVAEEYMHLMPRNTLFFRQTTDLQSFTSALGGAAADSITNSGDSERPFQVDGDTFTDFESAGQRSCDNQFNECSQRANEQGNKGDFKVEDCDDQKDECKKAQENARVKDFNSGTASTNIGPDPDFPDFDLICEA
ncbi:hypothetical protein BS50DRAFT_96514 [Corynespora cassiicola Philippines]|uniref:Uncharacterized protein n=1 Tax=Corynespora cassiicola Philippines TaxID=1448308 RepID=A0A2T2NFK8_CORCC|nr:hypothetical protein BS50DRAFT_96514 [Corynespora cassiicola Philippines]